MRQAIHQLTVGTSGKGMTDLTHDVVAWVRAEAIGTGLLTLWCKHTSASLTVQENADPTVRADIERYFEALAPEDGRRYVHDDEGPDDMPAHLRTMLTHRAFHSRAGWAAGAGQVAGYLSVRTSAQAASPGDRAASVWRMTLRS